MSYACFKKDCRTFPTTLVYCGKSKFILCPTHFSSHIETCGLEHKSISILRNLPTKKSSIEETLKFFIKGLTQEKKEIIIKMNEILEKLMIINKKSLDGIENIVRHCKTLLKIVREKDRIPIIYDLDSVNTTQISSVNIEMEINACRSFFISKIPDYSLLEKAIRKNLKFIVIREFSEYLDKNIHFFMDNSRILIKFDTLKLREVRITTQVSENTGYCPSICSVSKNEIFTTGGRIFNNFLDPCYLINNKTGDVKILPRIRKRNVAQAIYYNRRIYIFGGYDGKCFSNCDMLCMNNLSWKSFSDLPIPLGNTSVVKLKKDEFLIVGINVPCDRFCFSYNLIEDSFSNLSLKFSDRGKYANLLLRNNSRFYILSPNWILVSTISNLNNWVKNSNSTSFEETISRPVIRNGKAYFNDYYNKVYEFDFGKLKIKKLLKIT